MFRQLANLVRTARSPVYLSELVTDHRRIVSGKLFPVSKDLLEQHDRLIPTPGSLIDDEELRTVVGDKLLRPASPRKFSLYSATASS